MVSKYTSNMTGCISNIYFNWFSHLYKIRISSNDFLCKSKYINNVTLNAFSSNCTVHSTKVA